MLRRVEGTVTSADGTRLAVRRVGAGDPVVLLHGTGGGLHSWAGVADLLAADHRVWLVARRGYAPSDVPAGVNSFDREVADVHAVLSAVGDEDGAPAHLVGASYGATLALHAVRDAVPGHPQAARSLALYEPPLFASGPHLRPVLDRYRELLAAGDTGAAGLLFAERVSRVPLDVLASTRLPPPGPADSTAMLHDLEALAADTDDMHRWSAVDLPVLLMQGADTWDPMPATMDRLAAVLPAVARVRWTGQSHFATSTDPALVAGTLRRFWSGEAPCGSC